ncbi:hypothetical protein CerSpe_108110 [Prunus speciosa]
MMMIVFSVSQVQAQWITFLLKCMLFCHCVKASTICTALCLKDCKKTLPDPLYYCTLGCTTSICTNLSPEKLDGCADSGSENCREVYAAN